MTCIESEEEIRRILYRGIENKTLDFCGINFNDEYASFISDSILAENLFEFQHVTISHSKISQEGFTCIMSMISQFNCLETLVCRGIDLTKESALILSKLLQAPGA